MLIFKKAAKASKAKLTFAIPLLDFGFAIISDRDGRLNIFDTHSVRIKKKHFTQFFV